MSHTGAEGWGHVTKCVCLHLYPLHHIFVSSISSVYCLSANLVFIFLLVRGKVWRGGGEIWEEGDRDLEGT